MQRFGGRIMFAQTCLITLVAWAACAAAERATTTAASATPAAASAAAAQPGVASGGSPGLGLSQGLQALLRGAQARVQRCRARVELGVRGWCWAGGGEGGRLTYAQLKSKASGPDLSGLRFEEGAEVV